MERLLNGGGEKVLGGDTDKDDLYIAPAILVNVTNDDAVMQEEVRTCISMVQYKKVKVFMICLHSFARSTS